MILNPEAFDDFEDIGIKQGGGGGGKKKNETFGGQRRGERVGAEAIAAARENEMNGDSLKKVTDKVEDILKSDESMDAHEVKAYFEWVKMACICATEIKSMKIGHYGDPKLPPEMMLAGLEKPKFAHASGPGGQNVNKTNSAAFLKHAPTALYVHVEDTRDQEKNKEIAKERLFNLLCKHAEEWNTVIGGRDENKVMADIFEKALESKGEMKGVRGDSLRNVVVNLREGINLK